MFERNTSGTGLLQQHQSTNGNASYCSSNNGYTDMSVQNNGFSMSDYYSGGSHHHVGSGVAINGQSQHNAAMSYHHSLNSDSSLNGGYHYGQQSECCYDSYDLNPLNSHANGGSGHPMHYASTQQNGYDYCTAQDAYVGSNGALLYSAQCDALPQRGLLKPMHSTAANNSAAANGNNSCISGPDMYALMNGHYGGGAAAGGYHSSPTSSTSYASTGSDESDDLYGFPFKRSPSAVCEFDPKAKRPKQSKKRKPKRDPNEPQKPVSAYALFFRDTQAAIKGQNPNATFGEVSKIVASMWDSLDTDAKNIYKQKTETAKKDYLKQLAAYRASLVSKGSNPVIESFAEFSQAQRKLLSGNGASAQSTPDSTTAAATLGSGSTLTNGSSNGGEPMHHRSAGGSAADLLHEIGGNKSLASLIAEPSPQHVLTATTTLTVPPSYIPARMKTEFDEEAAAAALCLRAGCGRPSIEDPTWDNSYCSTDCVVTHCRDLFTTWIPTAQAGNGTYAPV